jgi:SNF2 family DNA or RNA helicase
MLVFSFVRFYGYNCKTQRIIAMFAGVRNLLGLVRVQESGGHITIDGVPTAAIVKDVSRVWGTTKITNNIFTKMTKNSLTFPSFFALEIYFIFDQLVKERKLGTSVRTLKKVCEEMLEVTWLANTQKDPTHTPLDLSRLNELDYPPKDFQREFFEAYNNNVPRFGLNGILLAGAPGSGKTYMCLAICAMSKADKTIIICPKNALGRVWESEIKARFTKKRTYWLSGESKDVPRDRDIYVFHYEALELAMKNASILRGSNTLVILDESHNLNELDSIRTGNFVNFCRSVNAKNIIEASGTPIKAMGGEAIPLLQAVDPLFTPEVQERFKAIFGVSSKRALSILKHRLGYVSFKIEKSRLGLDAPISETIHVKIPNGNDFTLKTIGEEMRAFVKAQLETYKKQEAIYTKDFFALLEKAYKKVSIPNAKEFPTYKAQVERVKKFADMGDLLSIKEDIKAVNRFEKAVIIPALDGVDKARFKEVKSLYKYVSLKVQGEALGRVVGRKRVECHLAMLPYIDFGTICESTEKKTLVFTSFVPVLESAVKLLEKQGMKPLAVYGATNSNLSSIVASFEKEDDLNPLVATFNSLSTAVPLVMADTMVLINSPFRTYILEQTISRIHRIGATTQTRVFTTLLDTGEEPNISTRSSEILAWSQEMVEAITGIKSPFQIDSDDTTVNVAAEGFGLSETINIADIGKPNVVFSNWAGSH